MMKDPVCGMQVDEKKAAATSMHGGQRYTFCSQDCKTKFDQNPDRYAQHTQQSKQTPQQPQHTR